MQEDKPNQSQPPQPAPGTADSVPHGSEDFRTIPNDSETFRIVPNDSEGFGTLRKPAERTEAHTLTVREVARLFEEAGVARTERSITNWCQKNAQGVARLDAYYDPNERKYYITSQSVDRAIEEEKAKGERRPETGVVSEVAGETFPNASETRGQREETGSEEDASRVSELELKVRDLEIATRVKDHVIAEKDKEMERMHREQGEYIDRLIDSNRRIGELETRLLQLESPRMEGLAAVPVETAQNSSERNSG